MVSRLVIFSCIVLGGCSTCPTSTWVKPIYPSRNDVLTRGTANQVITHNEAWEKINEGS